MIQLTDNAAKRIAKLGSKEEKPGAMLRIRVEGGGCSGFKYEYDFPVWEQAAEDIVVSNNGSTLLIDPISVKLMQDCIVDYIETLGSAGFEIKNPNTTAKCGCGNSFSV